MSLVITAMKRRVANARHRCSVSVVLPALTGPPMLRQSKTSGQRHP
jgi:hypothetical protein